MPLGIPHDIPGLQIAMDNPLTVGEVDRERRHSDPFDRVAERGPNLVQGLTIHQLKNDVGPSAILPDAVNGNDVGVNEFRHDRRLPLESFQEDARRHRSRGMFEGHPATKSSIPRLPDLSGPAATKRGDQDEIGDQTIGLRRCGLHLRRQTAPGVGRRLGEFLPTQFREKRGSLKVSPSVALI